MLYSDSTVRAIPALWKRGIKELIVRRFYSYVDGALFVGTSNRNYHLRYGMPAERLFPGILPIDLMRLVGSVDDRKMTRQELRLQLGIPADAFVVLFSGKYTARKRPMDLILAVDSLAQKELPVWALLVGEGPERSSIEQLCRRRDVRAVTLTGFVNQAAIPSYYAASDVLAVTSSRDPHPLVVSEAAAFGLPVIVSDRIGCIGDKDTAQPQHNALVYTCGDVARLSAHIEQLCRDRDLYCTMAAESLRISQSQDITVAVQQLASAVRRIHELGPRFTQKQTVTRVA
jgi:glycosyltransferase involved in cell wall biosynthesis